jgi:hypothetical protein
MVPKASLKIECAMVNPPQPIGCGVLVDGKVIATLTLEEVKLVVTRIEELEARWRSF